MKKTCNGCRALDWKNGCSLGYENSKVYLNGIGSPVIRLVPKEECEKPITYNQLFKAKNK